MNHAEKAAEECAIKLRILIHRFDTSKSQNAGVNGVENKANKDWLKSVTTSNDIPLILPIIQTAITAACAEKDAELERLRKELQNEKLRTKN